MDAGRLVRQARLEAELTQQAMAVRGGVSRQTVAHIEAGTRQTSVTTLVRLLAVAGKQMQVELRSMTTSAEPSRSVGRGRVRRFRRSST